MNPHMPRDGRAAYGKACMRVISLATAASALWLATSRVGLAQLSGGRELDATELAALAKGALVTRPLRVQRGELRLFGGSSWQVIDAEPQLVWQALLDTERYPHMLPAVIEARLVATPTPTLRHVYLHQGSWPILTSYYLILRSDPARYTLEFQLDQDRPHGLKAGWGMIRLVAYGPRKTLVAFGMLADVGHGILAWVTAGLIQTWMLKTPWAIKRYLDHGGRARYLQR